MAELLIITGTVFVAIALVLLVVLYRRERRISRLLAKRRSDDLTNSMILFQTMRDLVREQKQLAVDFNEALKTRMAKTTKVLEDTLNQADQVRRAQKQLLMDLNEVRIDMNSLQRELGYVSERADLAREKSGHPAPDESGACDGDGSDNREERPALRVLVRPDAPRERAPRPAAEEEDGGLYTFDTPESEDECPDGEEAPEEPEDPRAAREAFRALLHLGGANPGPSAADDEDDASYPGGNGRSALTPVQARVYEYSDAGMSTSDIARELGLPRGEVKLILSLREKE